MLSKEAKITFPLSSSSICSKTHQGDMRAWMQRENYPLWIPSVKEISSKMRRALNVNICRPSQSFLLWMVYKKTTKYIGVLETVKKNNPPPLSHPRSKVCLNRAVVKALWNARWSDMKVTAEACPLWWCLDRVTLGKAVPDICYNYCSTVY